VQRRAAAALGNLCAEDAKNRDCVRECGGAAALVRLLARGGPAAAMPTAVREAAAIALANLCNESSENQDSVRECGGVPSYIGLGLGLG